MCNVFACQDHNACGCGKGERICCAISIITHVNPSMAYADGVMHSHAGCCARCSTPELLALRALRISPQQSNCQGRTVLMCCSAPLETSKTIKILIPQGVLATTLGFFLLGGVEAHFLNVAGICCNMAGGTWYTVIKYQQTAARPQLTTGAQLVDIPSAEAATSCQDCSCGQQLALQ